MSQAPNRLAKGSERRLEELAETMSNEAESVRDAMAELVASLKGVSETSAVAVDYLATVDNDPSLPPTSFDTSAFIRRDAADSISEEASSVHRDDFLAFAAARGHDPTLAAVSRDPTFTAMPSVVTWATPVSARSAENPDVPSRNPVEGSVEGTPRLNAKDNAVSDDPPGGGRLFQQEETVENTREEQIRSEKEQETTSDVMKRQEPENEHVVDAVNDSAQQHLEGRHAAKRGSPRWMSGLPSVVTWTITGLLAPQARDADLPRGSTAASDVQHRSDPAEQEHRPGGDGQERPSHVPSAVSSTNRNKPPQVAPEVSMQQLQFRAMPSVVTWHPGPSSTPPSHEVNARPDRPHSAAQSASPHPRVASGEAVRFEDGRQQPSPPPQPVPQPVSTPTAPCLPSVVTWTLPPRSERQQPGAACQRVDERPGQTADGRGSTLEAPAVQSQSLSPEASRFQAMPSVVTWHRSSTPAGQAHPRLPDESRGGVPATTPAPDSAGPRTTPASQRAPQESQFRAMPSVVTWHPTAPALPPREVRGGSCTEAGLGPEAQKQSTPPPVQAMPSVVTWTVHSPASRPTRHVRDQSNPSIARPQTAAGSLSFRAMPSVVTWTLPGRKGAQNNQDAKPTAADHADQSRPVAGTFAAMPSVVTWMSRPSASHTPQQQRQKDEVLDGGYLAMPSVVTWASSARPAGTVAGAGAGACEEGAEGGELEVRVLLVGGRNEFEEVSDIDELSGAAGAPAHVHAWKASARELKGPRNLAAALPAVGPDGLGMVAGGFGGGLHLATCELVPCRAAQAGAGSDAVDWAGPGSRMLFKRSGLGLAGLDDAAYAVGGFDGQKALKMVEVLRAGPSGWSDAESKWREVHMMAQPRYRPSAVGAEGQVLVFGGFDGDKILSSAAAFTPDGDAASSGGHGKWRQLPDMPHARMGAAALLFREHVIIVGGSGPGRRMYAEIDVFDIKKDAWVSTLAIPPIPQPCSDSTVFVLDGNLWVVGGSDSKSWLDIVQVFEWDKQSWSAGHPLCGPVSGACSLEIQA